MNIRDDGIDFFRYKTHINMFRLHCCLYWILTSLLFISIMYYYCGCCCFKPMLLYKCVLLNLRITLIFFFVFFFAILLMAQQYEIGELCTYFSLLSFHVIYSVLEQKIQLNLHLHGQKLKATIRFKVQSTYIFSLIDLFAQFYTSICKCDAAQICI